MKEITESEKHNIEWLKSVCIEGSGYTRIFKEYSRKNIEKLESIIIETSKY